MKSNEIFTYLFLYFIKFRSLTSSKKASSESPVFTNYETVSHLEAASKYTRHNILKYIAFLSPK